MDSNAAAGRKGDSLRSVRRALDVLNLLADYPDGLLIKRISRDLGLNISTTYHLLNTLLDARYVERDPETSTIRLGSRVAFLSNSVVRRSADAELWKPVRPLLYRLTETTGAASYLASWESGDTELQAIAEGPSAEKVPELYVGFRGYSHLHALGRALLAAGGEPALAQYLAHATTHATSGGGEAPPVDAPTLARLVAETRERGYALDLEEFKPGVCCISIAVRPHTRRNDDRPLAAVAISLPPRDFIKHRDWLVRQVVKIGEELSCFLTTQPQPATLAYYV